MLVVSDGLFATFALFLSFSFAEISQTSGNQPLNGVDDTLKLSSEHKSRNKRLVIAQPTSFSPTTDDDLSPGVQGSSNTLSSTAAGAPVAIDQGNVQCGTKKPNSRIVGGTNARPGSWPWQVLIDFKPFRGPVWCGGSILTPYWIVTAAHCFDVGKNTTSFILTAGEHNLRTVDGTEQIIPIDKIIVHPNYDSPTTGFDYDVALIKLKKPINYNINVRPVCLPTMDFPPGTNCYVTGWGYTKEGGNSAQILQQAQIPLVPRDTCQRAFSDFAYEITERMRCAGFFQGGVDSCDGDSGGPLVCPSNNKWYLVGIVSFGVGCARPNRFGVYSDMLVLKTWVQETINNHTTL